MMQFASVVCLHISSVWKTQANLMMMNDAVSGNIVRQIVLLHVSIIRFTSDNTTFMITCLI